MGDEGCKEREAPRIGTLPPPILGCCPSTNTAPGRGSGTASQQSTSIHPSSDAVCPLTQPPCVNGVRWAPPDRCPVALCHLHGLVLSAHHELNGLGRDDERGREWRGVRKEGGGESRESSGYQGLRWESHMHTCRHQSAQSLSNALTALQGEGQEPQGGLHSTDIEISLMMKREDSRCCCFIKKNAHAGP